MSQWRGVPFASVFFLSLGNFQPIQAAVSDIEQLNHANSMFSKMWSEVVSGNSLHFRNERSDSDSDMDALINPNGNAETYWLSPRNNGSFDLFSSWKPKVGSKALPSWSWSHRFPDSGYGGEMQWPEAFISSELKYAGLSQLDSSDKAYLGFFTNFSQWQSSAKRVSSVTMPKPELIWLSSLAMLLAMSSRKFTLIMPKT